MLHLEPGPRISRPGRCLADEGKDFMIRLTTALTVLGTFGFAMTAHAASDPGRQARSNGPNMPLSRDVVPSEIRPQEPAATGSMKGRAGYGGKSRWRDIRRPPVRPPSL